MKQFLPFLFVSGFFLFFFAAYYPSYLCLSLTYIPGSYFHCCTNPDRHGSASVWELDPDPHQSGKKDSDPHQSEMVEASQSHCGALEGQNLEKVSVRIQIRIKLKGVGSKFRFFHPYFSSRHPHLPAFPSPPPPLQ